MSTAQAVPFKKDYFVPNFGADKEIVSSEESTKLAEDKLGYKMNASFKPAPGFKKDYFVPNFGLDHDILTTQQNDKAAAKEAGKKAAAASLAQAP